MISASKFHIYFWHDFHVSTPEKKKLQDIRQLISSSCMLCDLGDIDIITSSQNPNKFQISFGISVIVLIEGNLNSKTSVIHSDNDLSKRCL